jgi:BirA family biotin operon repressor/biotin-[acetyl-CoA-carboxylase] ligase
LNGAKISGILLEKSHGEYMIIGIGVNIVQSPPAADVLYPATSLKAAGITTKADEFLHKYLPEFAKNMALSVTVLRQKWMDNAKGIGKEIIVRQGGTEQKGIFKGIDENADLILQTASGMQKILAGDVFYAGEENG